MKIRIIYHVVAKLSWQEVTNKCIEKMKLAGLWDSANEIHMMCHYDPALFDNFIKTLETDNRIKWHLFSNSIHMRGESYTNHKLKQICDQDQEEWLVLRLHNKSSNYENHPDRELAYMWRDLIEYWNINRWQLLVSKLEEGYDVASNQWLELPWPHFSGNVWWAKSSYIKQLPLLKLPTHKDSPTEIDVKGWSNRHEAEAWVGLKKPKAWSAWPSLTDWTHPVNNEAWNNGPQVIPFNNKE
jgi:hypothetical protein